MYKTAHWANLKKVLAQDGIQVTKPLFHSTSLAKAQKIIAEGFKARAGGPGNDAYYDNAVCFTRNLEFAKKGMFGNAQVIFVLDERDLASRYKTYSYDWVAVNRPSDDRKSQDYHEYETRVSLTPGKYIPTEKASDQEDYCLVGTTIGSQYIKAILIKSYTHGDPLQEVYISRKPTYVYSKNSYYRYEKLAPEGYIPLLTPNERVDLAMTAQTDNSVLAILAEDSDKWVRCAVAKNINVSYDILEKLSEDNENLVKVWVAANKKTPARLLLNIAINSTDVNAYKVRETIVENPNVTPDILDQLSNDSSYNVRLLVANNHLTPTSALDHLSYDEGPVIREAVAYNDLVSDATLKRLVNDPVNYVAYAAKETLERNGF